MPTIEADPPLLKTDRLRLRRVSADDIDRFVLLLSEHEVAKFLTRVPHPYTAADARSFLDYAGGVHEAGRGDVMTITLREDDDAIGIVGIELQDGEPASELGYWLGQDYQGNGYMREAVAEAVRFAFEDRGLTELYATTDTENLASQTVLQNTGFVTDRKPLATDHPKLGPRQKYDFRLRTPGSKT